VFRLVLRQLLFYCNKKRQTELNNRRTLFGKVLFIFIVISSVYVFSHVMVKLGIDKTLLQFIILGVFLVLVILNGGKKI